jgi:CHAT domain-containing protein
MKAILFVFVSVFVCLSQTPDSALQREPGLRESATRFFEAYREADEVRMKSFWKAESPFVDEFFQPFAKQKAEGKLPQLGIAKIGVSRLAESVFRLRVDVESDGKLWQLTVQYVSDEAGWKIGRIREAFPDFLQQLANAPDGAAKEQLVSGNADLLASGFCDQLWTEIIQQQRGGQRDFAGTLIDIGLDRARVNKDDRCYGRMLIRRSNFREIHHEYGDATADLFASLELSRRIGDKEIEALSFYNLARMMGIQGNKSMAEEYLDRAGALAEELNLRPLINQVLNLRAINTTDPAVQLKLHEKLLEITTQSGNVYGQAVATGNAAYCHSDLGDQKTAIEKMTWSLTKFESMNAQGEVVEALKGIGMFHERKGELSNALSWTKRAYEMSSRPGFDPVPTGRQLIQIHRKMGRLLDALPIAEENIKIAETARIKSLLDEVTQANFLKERQADYQNLSLVLGELGRPLEGLRSAELFKARVLFDIVRGGKSTPDAFLTENERQRQQRLNTTLAQVNRELTRQRQRDFPDKPVIADLDKRLNETRSAIADFQLSIFATKPELRLRRGDFQPIGEDDIGAMVPDARTALVEFAVTNEKSFVYVISKPRDRTEIRVFPIDIRLDELEKRIKSFRALLQSADLGYRAEARKLYDLLLSGARGELTSKNSIVIVPDSIMWDVPFQALVTPNDKFLIETHAISYAPSLTALRELRAKMHWPGTSRRLLAFGNPAIVEERVAAIEKLRGERLEPLPSAEREVDLLGNLFGARNSRVLKGADATESVFVTAGSDADILHFATHGILNSNNPLYSALVLSASENSSDDGLLEAWELMEMKLNASLAVLSACETARGHTVGEGIVGLSWAFFVAGVPRVVASQWKVESRSTSDLMTVFYKNLKTDKNPSVPKALQKSMIRQIRSGYRKHPFYWAGFIAIGG